jgi:hypothetical protein
LNDQVELQWPEGLHELPPAVLRGQGRKELC